MASETVDKIMIEADNWFHAQSLEVISNSLVPRPRLKWMPPPDPWLKCNIDYSWSQLNSLGGAAWVLRDAEGNVKLHSCRGFSQTNSIVESQLFSIFWTLDCLKYHRVDKIVFGVEASDFVDAINRPRAWPSFHYQTGEVCYKLEAFVN